MDIASMVLALFGVIAVALVFGFVASRIEGLALFAPNSTRGVAGSAGRFCERGCRTADGRCPLTGTAERAADCPLWRFVGADVPTQLFGSPFEPIAERATAG